MRGEQKQSFKVAGEETAVVVDVHGLHLLRESVIGCVVLL